MAVNRTRVRTEALRAHAFGDLQRQPQEPSPSTERQTLNVAVVFAVLLGSLTAGSLAGLAVWAFWEFDSR